MTTNYRQGNHSKVNVWLQMDGLKDTQIAMATSDHWAAAICEALNEQMARENGNLGPSLDPKERAMAGLYAFLHHCDMGGDLSDVDPELVARLRRWCNAQKRPRS